MRIESDGHSRGNPRLYELIEHAPKTGKSPTVWAWPELIDYLKIAGQPVPGPWPPHQQPRPDPEEDSLPVAVADTDPVTPDPSERPQAGQDRPPGPAILPNGQAGHDLSPGLLDSLTGIGTPARTLEDRMYPSRFRYEAPRSLGEAIGLLHDGGDDAKVLAGGQSLVPLMKLRFASPELVVDINNLPGLDYHRRDPDGTIRIGALCRHADLERSDLLPGRQPTMAAAAPLIADPIVRNRGTLVGSLCHADPQGDWASVVLALGGSVVAQGPGGTRTIPIGGLRHGPVPERAGAGRDRGGGGHPAPRRDTRRAATSSSSAGSATSPRSASRWPSTPPATGHPGRDRADRRRRIDHRRHGGGRGAGRGAALAGRDRAGRAARGRGGPAPDRPPRQRGL